MLQDRREPLTVSGILRDVARHEGDPAPGRLEVPDRGDRPRSLLVGSPVVDLDQDATRRCGLLCRGQGDEEEHAGGRE